MTYSGVEETPSLSVEQANQVAASTPIPAIHRIAKSQRADAITSWVLESGNDAEGPVVLGSVMPFQLVNGSFRLLWLAHYITIYFWQHPPKELNAQTRVIGDGEIEV